MDRQDTHTHKAPRRRRRGPELVKAPAGRLGPSDAPESVAGVLARVLSSALEAHSGPAAAKVATREPRRRAGSV